MSWEDELGKHLIPDESTKPIDPTWHFVPSEGEPFTMTMTEVADAMAFVRMSMARAEKAKSRYVCPKCGGSWDGIEYTSNPIKHQCASCGEYWVP